MSKYLNPYTDFGFKKLFGTELNKDLLISFLNALFEKCNELPKDEIEDVTYLNAEKLGRAASERRAIFDVYCTTKSGAKFIVEMQNVFQQFSYTHSFSIIPYSIVQTSLQPFKLQKYKEFSERAQTLLLK